MHGIRKWIRYWLGFSRGEANGFLVLLPLMMVVIFSEPLYRYWRSFDTPDFTAEQAALDSLVAAWPAPELRKSTGPQTGARPTELFAFNPNSISEKALQRLGFSENLSTRIAHYRQKGGVFRVKADLMNIYGMDSSLYHQLYAYIQLPEQPEMRKTRDVTTTTPTGEKAKTLIDINAADTTQLKSIYGIGSTRARRIVKFRDGLGGFVSQHQLAEVYGLDSAVLAMLEAATFIDQAFEPKKINMNSATEQELATHPYIKKTIAKAIVAYRFQHGHFKNVGELSKLALVTPQDALRIAPYLTVEN